MISGNAVGSYSHLGKTFTLVDESGTELIGVVTENEVKFTATDNDVREGCVYASDGGVSTGTKDIPSYYTIYGSKIVLAGYNATITTPEYNYKNILVTISTYDTSWSESVSVVYVSVDGCMYAVNSSNKLSDITIDYENETINLGITVNEKSVLRYFITREEI